VQVLFFEEQLEKQLVEPSIQVPVDEPQVVAGDVIAEVGKLDALPLALAAPLPFHPAAKDFSRYKLEALELGEKLGRKERWLCGGDHSSNDQ
jgi:hypothetical protein